MALYKIRNISYQEIILLVHSINLNDYDKKLTGLTLTLTLTLTPTLTLTLTPTLTCILYKVSFRT